MFLSASRPATRPSAAQGDCRIHGQIQASAPVQRLLNGLRNDVHLRLSREIGAQAFADLAGAPALLQVFTHELLQLRVGCDLPYPLAAPSTLGTALSRARTVVARGFVNVPADFSAYSRRTAPKFHGDSANAPPGTQEVCDRDPFRLGEKPGGDYDRPLMRDGSNLFDVSRLQNNRVAVPPASAGTTADSDDSAGLRVAHSLFHQLIIVSPCSVLWRSAPGLSWSFHLCQLQLLKAQVLQRPLDAKPAKWLSFRPSLTSDRPPGHGEAGSCFRYSPAGTDDRVHELVPQPACGPGPRGTSGVDSKKERRSHPDSSQYQRYLDQTRPPARPVTEPLKAPRYSAGGDNPASGAPGGRSVSNAVTPASGHAHGDDTVVGQVEEDGGSITCHPGSLVQGSWSCSRLNA